VCSEKRTAVILATFALLLIVSFAFLLPFYLTKDTVKFVQRNGCSFWDKQARPNGHTSCNYGQLTNFPVIGRDINQLETNVIQKLSRGESSRNMVCSLVHPGENSATSLYNECSICEVRQFAESDCESALL
jgi:thymidylate synthase